MPRLSRRVGQVPANAIRELTPLVEAAKARGVHVHHLNIGQPDLPTPAPVMRALGAIALETVPYGDSRGEPELIEAQLADLRRLGAEVTREQIFVTAGASEALTLALTAIADAGDLLLTPDPTYANYRSFAAALDLQLAPIPTFAETGWHLPADLEAHFEAATRTHGRAPRALLISNPGNPTGAVHDLPALQRVVDWAEAHDLFVIVDEVYRGLVYGEHAPATALSLHDPGARVIVLDSSSKRYSTCGFRIGALLTRHPELQAAVMRLCQARLSTSVVAQKVVAQVATLGEAEREAVRLAYRDRLQLAREALGAMPGVSAPPAEGAFYQMATLPVRDAQDFVRFLLADFALEGETVMVSPAAGFYLDPNRGRDQIRIACVLDRAPMTRALRCLAAGLAAYRRDRE